MTNREKAVFYAFIATLPHHTSKEFALKEAERLTSFFFDEMYPQKEEEVIEVPGHWRKYSEVPAIVRFPYETKPANYKYRIYISGETYENFPLDSITAEELRVSTRRGLEYFDENDECFNEYLTKCNKREAIINKREAIINKLVLFEPDDPEVKERNFREWRESMENVYNNITVNSGITIKPIWTKASDKLPANGSVIRYRSPFPFTAEGCSNWVESDFACIYSNTKDEEWKNSEIEWIRNVNSNDITKELIGINELIETIENDSSMNLLTIGLKESILNKLKSLL